MVNIKTNSFRLGNKVIEISDSTDIQVGDKVYVPASGFVLEVTDKDEKVKAGKFTHISIVKYMIGHETGVCKPLKIVSINKS